MRGFSAVKKKAGRNLHLRCALLSLVFSDDKLFAYAVAAAAAAALRLMMMMMNG